MSAAVGSDRPPVVFGETPTVGDELEGRGPPRPHLSCVKIFLCVLCLPSVASVSQTICVPRCPASSKTRTCLGFSFQGY